LKTNAFLLDIIQVVPGAYLQAFFCSELVEVYLDNVVIAENLEVTFCLQITSKSTGQIGKSKSVELVQVTFCFDGVRLSW